MDLSPLPPSLERNWAWAFGVDSGQTDGQTGLTFLRNPSLTLTLQDLSPVGFLSWLKPNLDSPNRIPVPDLYLLPFSHHFFLRHAFNVAL